MKPEIDFTLIGTNETHTMADIEVILQSMEPALLSQVYTLRISTPQFASGIENESQGYVVDYEKITEEVIKEVLQLHWAALVPYLVLQESDDQKN